MDGNHPHHRQGIHRGIAAPSLSICDVLNGRGQGVQRHPGNVKYRTLVFVNKGLYAKCPRADKIKISKGIVAAVRELGGRFLELDERTGLYHDIGDKKATDKASQALREGQKKIRKQIYKDEEKMIAKRMYDTSLLATRPSQNGRGISSEGYFGYSVQVLESLYRMDENENASWAPASAWLLPVQSQTLASAPVPNAVNSDSGLAHMAMALDQFPGAVQSPPPQEPDPRVPDAASMSPPPSQRPALRWEMRRSVGRFTDEVSMRGSITELGRCTLARLSNISFTSTSSISQMLELARGEPKWTADGHRNSIESILSDEIRDLIKISEPQLKLVENMSVDELVHGVKEIRVEAEMEDAARMDRVSDLRFTDLSSNGAVVDDGNVADAQLLLRLSNGV